MCYWSSPLTRKHFHLALSVLDSGFFARQSFPPGNDWTVLVCGSWGICYRLQWKWQMPLLCGQPHGAFLGCFADNLEGSSTQAQDVVCRGENWYDSSELKWWITMRKPWKSSWEANKLRFKAHNLGFISHQSLVYRRRKPQRDSMLLSC